MSAVRCAVLVAVENGACSVVERHGEGVVGFLCGEGDVVAVDVGLGKTEYVGRAQSRVAAEEEHIL